MPYFQSFINPTSKGIFCMTFHSASSASLCFADDSASSSGVLIPYLEADMTVSSKNHKISLICYFLK